MLVAGFRSALFNRRCKQCKWTKWTLSWFGNSDSASSLMGAYYGGFWAREWSVSAPGEAEKS